MSISKNSCRKIAAVVFLSTTMLTTYFYTTLKLSDILSLTGGLFTGSITAGIWLETSYRFLVKEATAPIDKLVEKL